MANRLINEKSPYLRQHARNPVEWYPWGEEALNKAASENKLLIISIGYAACHWCHVMERECFEDAETARFMNDNFISVKVDREERPDIDSVYMDAVQILTGSGGWPLNVIALPDGRPIYGGTYFPRQNWISMLSRILQFSKENGVGALRQAEVLAGAVAGQFPSENGMESKDFAFGDLEKMYQTILNGSDAVNGGLSGAPKFPLPSCFRFLLHYAYMSGENQAEDLVFTTLDKMSRGGIYDQIGGGFARYSVDSKWFVPHFEKMLYDNAQLVSLYSEAFASSGNSLYERAVRETLDFVDRELTSPEGAFYSSLDADSEGREGEFYTWTEEEMDRLLGAGSPAIKAYYSVHPAGNWEDQRNILHIESSVSVPEGLDESRKLLFRERSQRIRPGLDDKVLTAWNGLMIRAYTDAYKVLGHRDYLKKAEKAVQYLLSKRTQSDGSLIRMEGSAFLDDYAFLSDGLIGLYEATFREEWLEKALSFTSYSLDHFSDESSALLYYTSDRDSPLFARKKELIDNVIPSSNSQTALNLFRLGHFYDREDFTERAMAMVGEVAKHMLENAAHFGNWGRLAALMAGKPFEAVIAGGEWDKFLRQMSSSYLPDVFFCGGTEEGGLPLMKGKISQGKTAVYLCRDKTCERPLFSPEDALNFMREKF